MERRTLEDYRSEGRLPAADVCACGGRYEDMLLNLDPEQQTGTARIWGQHREGCWALEDALMDVLQGVSQTEDDQVAGWGWRQESLDLLGVTYPLYDWCLDVAPYLACWRLIVGAPLLLFGSQGMLAFCQGCFEARGLGQFLQIGPHRE